tara:strand:- start:14101 stop:15090 length:990 start_codon:yes stop_codon:yes gene_type:complete
MKFGIYRHENSIGNSAEHVYALSFYLLNNSINPSKIEVYVQHPWQKDFVCCIEGIKEENVKFFSKPVSVEDREEYSDIHMPCVYGGPNGFLKTFDSNWDYLNKQDVKRSTLRFDSSKYNNKFELPSDSIVLFCREKSGWHNKNDRKEQEEHRFVKNFSVFHKLTAHYSNLGFKVVRIGDRYQQPLPGTYKKFKYGANYYDENVIDFTKYLSKSAAPLWTLKDYLYVIQNCKLFISCDAGIWPMAGAMKKNMVFCNVAPFRSDGSDIEFDKNPNGDLIYKVKKPRYSLWLPEDTTRVIVKKVVKKFKKPTILSDTPIEVIVKNARELANV